MLLLSYRESYIIMDRNKELKVHRLRLPGRSLCSIRSNRKWCKRRGSSLQCQNCFFVYPIIDCNLKNLSYNNLYMHKKQYIYENTLNPKSTQFIFPYIKCSRIFHFLTKCFPYQNFKIIDIKFWKECISIFNI